MKTFTLFELLKAGPILFANEEYNLIISLQNGVFFALQEITDNKFVSKTVNLIPNFNPDMSLLTLTCMAEDLAEEVINGRKV